jgi:hypothetical protein
MRKETWGYLITRISDSGQGIKQEKMADLFKTFKKDFKQTDGIGIGLSTAKELCTALGGNIFVSSIEKIKTEVIFAI